MTKKDLLLALQPFPEDVALRVTVGGTTVDLDRVEFQVDATPQVAETTSGGLSWQQMLIPKLRVSLIGKEREREAAGKGKEA